MDIVEIQAIYYMVAATGVLIAAVFYILNLRETRRNQDLSLKAQRQTQETRQIQAIIGFMQDVQNTLRGNLGLYLDVMNAKWENIDDFYSKYGPATNPDFWSYLLSLCFRYNVIGLMVRDGLLDVKAYVEYLGDTPPVIWDKYREVILYNREVFHFPAYQAGFEYLAKAINDYRVGQGWGVKPPDDWRYYATREASS